jgi:hypothetical protein
MCACPPTGTDSRFPKCIFPRPATIFQLKGPRDEVDIIARKAMSVVLVECKPRLSDSLSKRNILGETDAEKLFRICRTYPSHSLASVLTRALGVSMLIPTEVTRVLAVGAVDAIPPDGFVVINALSTPPIVFVDGIAAHESNIF